MSRPRAALLVVLSLAACGESAPAPSLADGARLFAVTCARCHGPDGGGGVAAAAGLPAPRNFRDATFQSARGDDDLRAVIASGKGAAMPSFAAVLEPRQIATLVVYVRSLDPRRR